MDDNNCTEYNEKGEICDICYLQNPLDYNKREVFNSWICIQCAGAVATTVSWAFKEKEDFDLFGNHFKQISRGKCNICTNKDSIGIPISLCILHNKSCIYYEDVKKHKQNMKWARRRVIHGGICIINNKTHF
jgi:hypothetical protein